MKKTISLILVAFLLFGMLPLQSKAAEDTVVTRPVALVEDATTVLPATEISASAAVSLSGSPYAYTDTSRFSGRTITKLGIPVKSVDTSKGTPIFTLSVVRTDTSGTTYTYVAKYPLEISVEGDPNAVNDWVYVDLTHLNLTLQENETLAFGSPTDTVSWGYLPKSIDKKYTFRSTSTQWTISNNNSIIFDVYTEETLRFAENAQGEKVATCEAPVFSGLKSILATGALAAADTVSSQTAPFAYSNSKNIFEGKKITKIGIPVKTVAAVNSNQTFTLSVVRTDSTEYVFVDQYTLKLPLAQLGKTKTVNRWIYVDVSDLNITVGANESLAFGLPSDTVKWGFTWEYPDSAYFFRSAATDWDNQYGGIFFDVYYEKTISYEDYINEQQGADQKAQNEMLLRELLAGKTLSILGDSISTYEGYSNNIAYNSTIGSNAIYYKGTNAITDVNETWWMQTINRTAMTLNVNNSWSGDKVIERGAARALELDNNNDTAPDIIAVYLGINDSRTGVALETFTEQYTKMVQGMQEKYPNADVYLFALLYTPRVTSGVDPSDVVLYNEAIRQIAEEYGCGFVDLYHKSGIHSSNYSSYMADGDLHPNYAGMDLITQCFIDALVARLVTDHTHRYAAAVTAPTCTDRGYTTFTCICGDHYVDHYVDAAGHSYENGICTLCGEEQPGVTKPIISILGDSISTFSGYLPEGNATYYPATNVKKVEETWWMQLITELNAKLGVNESWSGSYVSAPSGARVPMASVSRVQNLGSNGTPDVIFFFGGTNDLAFDHPLGSFDPATAPTQVDLEATTWDTLADGYTAAILRMRHFYPETQIIAILPTVNKSYYNNATLEKCNTVLRAICDHYDVKYVDLVAAGFTTAMLGDATHPNVLGMDLITAAAKEVYLRNEEPAAVIEVNGQTFASFEDAYAWDPSGIFKLLTDLENITVSGSLQLDLNGFTATGISAEQLFVGDSSATVNAPGTGKLITTAPVEPDVTLGATRYIALQDADGTYSFHALELKLSAVTLRTNKAGIYYKATLSCDAALKNAITSYGIAVSILGMPTAAFEADENVAFTQLSGAPEGAFTSCSITNIFRADLSAEKNAIRGELPIYANAYLKLENGTVLMGSNASSYSMKDVMAYLNENFDSLQPNQQTLIRDFCAQWSGAMAAWELPKLLPAPSKEEAA